MSFAVVAVPAQATSGRPQPVANVEAVPGGSPGEIVVTWDAHPDGHQDHRVAFKPIDGKFQPVSDTAWNTYPLDNTVTLTGLVPGDEYRIRVRARFADGTISKWARPVSGLAAEEAPPEPTAPDKTTTAGETIASSDELRDHIEYPDTGPSIDMVTSQRGYTVPAEYYRSNWEYLVLVTDAIDPTPRGSHREYRIQLKDESNNVVPDWHPEAGERDRECGGPVPDNWVGNCAGPGWGLRATFSPPSDGDYTLRVTGGGRYQPTRIQIYRYIEVTDDCVGELDTNCELGFSPDSTDGAFHVHGDADWHRLLSLDPSQWYEIQLLPDHSADRAAANLEINGIYNGSRQFLSKYGTVVPNRVLATHTSATDIYQVGGIVTMHFSPNATGDYYVSVGTYGAVGDGIGHYTLTLTTVDAGDLANDDIAPGGTVGGYSRAGIQSEAEILVGNGYYEGAINFAGEYHYGQNRVTRQADRDWFKVDMLAANTYRFDLKAITLNDPQIGGIYSASGQQLVGPPTDVFSTAQLFNSRLEYTPTTDGTYYIEATVNEQAGQANIGTYRIKVEGSAN